MIKIYYMKNRFKFKEDSAEFLIFLQEHKRHLNILYINLTLVPSSPAYIGSFQAIETVLNPRNKFEMKNR